MLQVMIKQSAALALAAMLLAGCAGKMSSQRLGANQVDNPAQEIAGVVFYQPALFAETTVRTALINDGKLVGRSSDSPPACAEVTVERVLLMPDLAKPYRINYEPGLFEINRFGVTLNNGMLAGVNAQPSSDPKLPIPGVQTLASTVNPGLALVDSGQEAFVVPAQGRTNPAACNDGPVVIGYRRLVIP
jgi:hypothetical protein